MNKEQVELIPIVGPPVEIYLKEVDSLDSYYRIWEIFDKGELVPDEFQKGDLILIFESSEKYARKLDGTYYIHLPYWHTIGHILLNKTERYYEKVPAANNNE